MSATKIIDYENLYKLNLEFKDELESAYKEVINSGWFILGKKVETFENAFAKYLNAKYVVGVASGLDALFLSILAFDFPPQSEIIVPSNTYIATINAIINSGHIPVYVEPDIAAYNIDPAKIIEKITKNTKAIMIVHLYGKCCDMEPIVELCKKYNLKLIEDCAQSHGAKYKGKMSGTFGDTGAFSFYPTKNLGAFGDAGAVVCSAETVYNKIKSLRNYGSSIKYKNDIVGYNSRLDELQAAFLLVKLKYLDKINEHKRQLAKVYFENLNAQVVLPIQHSDYSDVFHIFAILYPQRNKLKEYLLKNNIKTEIHYPIAPCDQTSIQDYHNQKKYPLNFDDFIIARKIHNSILSLPCSYFHTIDEIKYVCEVINNFTESSV